VPQLTDEQILQARNIDLLSYLQTYEPWNVRQNHSGEYYMAEHDSLKMSNGKWFRHSTQEGGVSALDFLIKVRGFHFVDAVQSLTDGSNFTVYKEAITPTVHTRHEPPKNKKPLILPKPNRNNDRIIAYLRERGIGKEIINRCINAGILYESDKHRCVFVGHDEKDVVRFACERGTTDDLKKDVSGSSKRYGFTIPPQNPTGHGNSTVALFEGALDCLAHATIHSTGETGWDGHRLALSGVSSVALHGFLERNPQINSVYFCLDNDRAGMDATNRIIKKLLHDQRYSHLHLAVTPAPIGKDYADTAKAISQNSINKATINRPNHEAVF